MRRSCAVRAGRRRVEEGVLGFDGQLAALGHGIARRGYRLKGVSEVGGRCHHETRPRHPHRRQGRSANPGNAGDSEAAAMNERLVPVRLPYKVNFVRKRHRTPDFANFLDDAVVTHPLDQYPQPCLNLRSPSQRARLPQADIEPDV
jgi:hypothetical protein